MKTIRDHELIVPLLASFVTDDDRVAYLNKLLNRATLVPETGCLIWVGWSTGKGHANVSIDGRTVKVHRLVWALANNRPVPENHLVDHQCRVRPCVNPVHLLPVTNQENTHLGAAVLYQRAVEV